MQISAQNAPCSWLWIINYTEPLQCPTWMIVCVCIILFSSVDSRSHIWFTWQLGNGIWLCKFLNTFVMTIRCEQNHVGGKCEVKASYRKLKLNENWYDPCKGTFKYLYVCTFCQPIGNVLYMYFHNEWGQTRCRMTGARPLWGYQIINSNVLYVSNFKIFVMNFFIF